MDTIKIRIYNVLGGQHCTNSKDGQKIFNLIESSLKNQKKVELDFLNIESITLAFLNTAIGQLYKDNITHFIKSHLSVINMQLNDMHLLKRVNDRAKIFYSNPELLAESIKNRA